MGDFMKSAIDILSRNPKEDEQGFVGEIIEFNGVKLKVKKFLAAGGFSNVYLASNTKGELYAVKRLTGFDKDGCDKILNEIHLHKRLSNKNIVSLYGVSFVEKNMGSLKVAEYLLQTELCSQSLVDLVPEELSMCAILTIMNQAINAINYLHNMQPSIIHRDIKLENYLIATDGNLKLCDFGSATVDIFQPSEDWNMQKRNNLQDEMFNNTSPMYRAPEILDTWNNYPIGPKVDIWALGCVFFCILYKKHPFDDAAKLRITNGNYSIPNMPQYTCFHKLLRECLVVNPINRINSRDIITELKYICQHNGYTNFEETNLLSIPKNDTLNNKEKQGKSKPDLLDEQRSEENISSVQSFLNSNALLSSIKDGANTVFKNFIGTSSKVLSSMQSTRTNINIFHLTSRIIVSCQSSIDVLQKYLEASYLSSNISVYNFSGSISRLPPPVRTVDIQFENNNEAKVLDLEHLYYLIEEMFGFLSSGEKYILVLQDNKNCNITALTICALFLYAGLTQFIEDALQIFAVKVHPISLLASEFRYLKYIKQIIKGNLPHNKSSKFVSMAFQNFGDFYQLVGDSKLVIEIFENGRSIFSESQLSLSDIAGTYELKIDKNLLGNILITIAFQKNTKFSEKSSKTKVGNIQFHTGFLRDNQKSLKFSKEDLDLEFNYPDFHFNCWLFVNYNLTSGQINHSKKWGNAQLKKDPKMLFSSVYEFNEILENFVGTQVSVDSFNDFEDLSDETVSNINLDQDAKYENVSNIINENNSKTNICDNVKEFPALLDFSVDNLQPVKKEEILVDTKDYTTAAESNDLGFNQLLDIFDQSFQKVSMNDTILDKNEKTEKSNDPFADLLGSQVKNSDTFQNLNSSAQSKLPPINCEFTKKQNDGNDEKPILSDSLPSSNVNANNFESTQKNTSQTSSDFLNFNSNNFESTQKSGSQSSDFFADLLGQQGYSFAKKTSSEPKTINDLRKQEILSNMDEEDIKIFKWTEGKRANIRALLCSMHSILWEDAKWSKCEMHQLITLPEVKKAYRKACLAVHPDKHVGTENERLSKMIFVELNTAWSNFNAENL